MSENIEQKIKLTFENNADENAKDVNKLTASIDKTTDATTQNTNANKTLKAQLREANQELQKSVQLYGQTSKETIEAAKQVAKLKDEIGFAKDISERFNPDQKMKALGAATQLAGTGLQGATAGMALFGGESEDTQKQLLKVQAAMAFSDAISNLSNLGDQWQLLKATIQGSSIATKANAAATGVAAMIQNVFTGSVATTTTGFKALKFAIAATGIGLLVVGLVAVYQNFDKISKFATNLVPGLAKVGDVVMSIVNAVTDFIGVTSEAGRAVDRMKANADASISLNKKFLAEHGSQLDEFTKQKIAAKDKYNEAIKEDGANQKALAAELNRELAKIEYSRGDEQREIQENARNKAAEAAKAAREKEKAELEKKHQEEQELIRSQGERAREEYEAAEKLIADAKKANEDALKTENDIKVEKENADFELKKQSLIEKGLSTEEIEKEHKRNLAALDDEYYAGEADKAIKRQEDEAEIDKRILAQKQALHDAKRDLEENAFGFLKQIAGKNKVLQKGLIIAESALGIGRSIIAMNAANVTTTAEGAALAIPTAGASVTTAAGIVTANTISTGIGVAANIAATAKALSSLGGGSAPGGSQSSGGRGGQSQGASAAPQVNFQGSKENQIGNTIAGRLNEQAPIRVTVLENDITKVQANVQAKVVSNSF